MRVQVWVQQKERAICTTQGCPRASSRVPDSYRGDRRVCSLNIKWFRFGVEADGQNEWCGSHPRESVRGKNDCGQRPGDLLAYHRLLPLALCARPLGRASLEQLLGSLAEHLERWKSLPRVRVATRVRRACCVTVVISLQGSFVTIGPREKGETTLQVHSNPVVDHV